MLITARLLVLLLLLASQGYSALTQIQDTLLTPSGAKASGTVTITPIVPMVSAGGSSIGRVPVVHRFRDGSVDVSLEANDTATPSGSYYSVRYALTDGTEWLEYWTVPTPPSAACPTAPCTIAQVRQVSVTPVGLTILLTQLDISAGSEGQLLKKVSGVLTWSSDQTGAGGIDCSSSTELTVASGVLAVPGSACYTVDTEADSSSDTVDSVTCTTGDRFVLIAESETRTVVLDGTNLTIGDDFSLDSSRDTFFGVCITTNTVRQVSRSNGG